MTTLPAENGPLLQMTSPATVERMLEAAAEYEQAIGVQRDRITQLMADRDKLTAELEKVSAELHTIVPIADENQRRATDLRTILAAIHPNGGPDRTVVDGPGPDRTGRDTGGHHKATAKDGAK